MKRGAAWLVGLAAAIAWLAAMTIYLSQQEQPTGWLRGRAVAEESGQALPGIEIRLHRAGATVSGEGDFPLVTRANGSFHSKRIPAGLYQLQATSRAHQLRATNLMIEEGKVQEVNLELAPVAPFFDLRVPQHVFTPDEVPQVIGHGFLPGDSIDFTFYRVDPNALLVKKRGGLGRLLYSEQPPRHLVLEGNPALSPLGRILPPITRRDVEGVFRQRFDLPLRDPGIYLVVAKADSIQRLGWVMVTRLALITKQWGDQALAYVTDLKTGAPVAGANVQFSAEGGETVSGVTDAQGIFQARVPHKQPQFDLLARAERQGSQAFLTSWVYTGGEAGQERVYAYTDRPVYRPGHSVHFKGIARRFAGAGYAVLSGEPVEVKVRDPRDTLVYQAKLVTNQFGSYHGQLGLNDEAPTGYYRLVSTLDGREHESGFRVAEYRKPEYSIEVTTGKKRYTRGERIRAQVSAQYYFGAPVAGAKVAYVVRRSPYFFYPAPEEEAPYEEGGEFEGYAYGEVIEQGEAETDADGVARFSIATKAPFSAWKKPPEEEATDHKYDIEVTVTDPSRKEVTELGSTLVTQGEFKVLLTPVRWVTAPGQAAQVEVETRDYDGRPVPGVTVSVGASREVWRGRESSLGPETRGEVTTDANGKARFQFTPQTAGNYRVRARATDRRGNEIRETAYLWVTEEDYADLGVPYPELEIIADKKVYRQGHTATLLINSQRKGATALVTIEGPRLYERRLVELKGKSTRIEFAVRPEYAPNFFVCVAFVRDKKFMREEKRLQVSVEARRLQIEVRADQRRYAPGEQATYQLRTADWRGKPVSAELSVGVVDESIYAVAPESAPPMLGFFYPPRENAVSTAYSFPHIYLDADKSPVGIKVRKRFPDTAYWNPTVLTDAQGRATITFAMPDNLTTWRATVRGATLDTAVGEATKKVRTAKDLLVRLEAPRFMVQRDRLTLSALVHNYTRSEQSLRVWIHAPGLRFDQGATAPPEGLVLGPNQVRRLDWQVEVPSPSRREITVYVKAQSGLSDAMALTVPALPHGRERIEWRSGAVQAQASERLSVRRDAVAGASELRVRLAPSIASVMFGALGYLAHYPYGCTEQTMSAFLPDVVVARALRELGLSDPRLEKQLPDMVQTGLDRLYGYQHDDGGWGWWRYDQSDPWMTAYVVFGLITAKRSGFAVNDNALNRGVECLLRQVRAQPAPGQGGYISATPAQRHLLLAQAQPAPGQWGYLAPDRLYPLYVLSLATLRSSSLRSTSAARDGLVQEQVMQFYRGLDSLDPYNLALLATTLLELGRTTEAGVAAERLWQRGQETQALAWWKGRPGWGRGGDTETTGLALKALLAVNPNDRRLFKVVRWLVLNREGDGWVSTRDTAFILFALTDFLKHSQELTPDYEARLSLNGKTLLERRFTRVDLFAPEVEVKAGGRSLVRGDNLLDITKNGAGNLYYTLILRQFVGQGDLPEIITGAGITIARSYYRMVSARDPRTGVITTSPSPHAVADFRSGESILVRLKIASANQCEYVVVEDPLPAGCEVTERGELEPWEWDRWWSDLTVRDEKVAIFARRLPAGVSTIEYYLRPQIPGDYHVMPTQVYAMYNPDLRGSGAEARVRLR